MNFNLRTYLVEKQTQVNGTLLSILGSGSSNRITEAMRHSLMAGGKRLRPILCLAATEAVGGDPNGSLHAACALEMVHTYSLIHDDLPAMDDDDLRRGKPTCHVAFDEATAILAGDGLLTLTFQILSSQPRDLLPASKQLEVIHIIAIAVGYNGMIEGQMQDIASEGKHLDIDELTDLHRLKTGALIEASAHIGAILGNGKDKQVHKLKCYAKKIGLAFQVKDDILNVEGDPDVIGKAVGTDNRRNKNTFPTLVGIEESKRYAQTLVNDALRALKNFDNKADPLRAIASYIIERKK